MRTAPSRNPIACAGLPVQRAPSGPSARIDPRGMHPSPGRRANPQPPRSPCPLAVARHPSRGLRSDRSTRRGSGSPSGDARANPAIAVVVVDAGDSHGILGRSIRGRGEELELRIDAFGAEQLPCHRVEERLRNLVIRVSNVLGSEHGPSRRPHVALIRCIPGGGEGLHGGINRDPVCIDPVKDVPLEGSPISRLEPSGSAAGRRTEPPSEAAEPDGDERGDLLRGDDHGGTAGSTQVFSPLKISLTD